MVYMTDFNNNRTVKRWKKIGYFIDSEVYTISYKENITIFITVGKKLYLKPIFQFSG